MLPSCPDVMLPPHTVPEKLLLSLHAAIDGRSWWDASQKLLTKCFSHHFLVGGFSFRGEMPMVLKRTRPAPERDAEWWARNAAMHPMMHMMMDPAIKVHRVTDSMSVPEIKTHPYYHEFMKDEDWLYSVGLFFRNKNHLIGMLAVNRREEQGEFSPAEMRLLHRLHPHFETAIRRITRIQEDRSATTSMAAMLSRIPLPVAILSWDGDLIYINDSARQACLNWDAFPDHHSGAVNLSLARIPNTVIQACAHYASRHRSKQRLNRPPSCGTLTIRHPDDPALRVEAEPLTHPSDPFAKPVFLLHFFTSMRPQDTTLLVQKLSELSTAEKAVVERLLAGESNREIATVLGKSPATVKKQLESIYQKLGVRDRLRLTAMLQGSASP